jgi:microcystin-dependent protein
VPKNVTYHNPIHQEENTPLVTILEVRVDLKQATAVDTRKSPYNVDLSKAAFGGTFYPEPGSQWYLKKISGVWALMARAPQQNPHLDPALTPQPGDSFIGQDGTTTVVGDLHVNGGLSVGGGTDPDIGTIKIHPSNTPPTGWLICDGSAISRTTYSLLFTVIGTTYGVGDGSTTFNIPNLQGRVVFGRDSGQTEFDVLGETGGEKKHTLITAELASHTHSNTFSIGNQSVDHTHGVSITSGTVSSDHSHNVGRDTDGGSGTTRFTVHSSGSSGAGGQAPTSGISANHTHDINGNTGGASVTHNHALSGSVSSAGSDTAHNVLNPYIVLNYIIKVVGSFTPPSSVGSGITDIAFHAVGAVFSDIGYTATAQGDTNNRFSIDDSGKQLWGPGNTVGDTNLYRSAVDTLKTDDNFIAVGDVTAAKGRFGGSTGDAVFIGDDVKLVDVNGANTLGIQGVQNAANGIIVFGSGLDTNLYRSSANLLRTDDTFQCASLLVDDNTNFPNAVGWNSNASTITTFNTSSTSYVSVTGAAVTIVKQKAGTTLRVEYGGAYWIDTAGASAAFGVLINGVDYTIWTAAPTVINGSRTAFGGVRYITGLAAGSWVVQARVKRVAGGGAVYAEYDGTNSTGFLDVMEVK